MELLFTDLLPDRMFNMYLPLGSLLTYLLALANDKIIIWISDQQDFKYQRLYPLILKVETRVKLHEWG